MYKLNYSGLLNGELLNRELLNNTLLIILLTDKNIIGHDTCLKNYSMNTLK
jgi:hypothetical protein